MLLPFQPADVYPQVLASADVLISLINAEANQYSIPSKVLTYLCAGRPILLSMPYNNDAAQAVISAEAGLTSEPGDLTGFLENADKFIQDESFRIQLGKNARHYAESHFDIDTIYTKFASILESI